MGASSRRLVGKAVPGEGWRIWDNMQKKWWGERYAEYPAVLLEELNDQKRSEILTELNKVNRRARKRKKQSKS